MSWSDTARSYIEQVHASLPADATFDQRVKALRDGYPFSMRKGWAYKAWLGEQRRYLAKYAGPQVDTKRFPLTPLERAISSEEGRDE